MKKLTLGHNLLLIYGFVFLFNFLIYNFDLPSALSVAGEYPTIFVLRHLLGVIFIIPLGYLGLIGGYLFYNLIQIAVLYFGGNWLEKVFKK